MKIKPEDHPDISGCWIWTALEIRWIEDQIAKAVKDEREACARLSTKIPNPYKHCQISAHGYDMGILEYSRAIRAQGKL